MPDLTARVTLLERQAVQQADLTDQLRTITARLAQGQALHEERLSEQRRMVELLGAVLAQHEERMQRLETILQAIRDLLERGNGH